jgi:hypothetical protein
MTLPALGIRCHLLQMNLRLRQLFALRAGMREERPVRRHPVVDLLVEIAQRAGEIDEVQHNAEHEAQPGVQPGHRLAEALFHGVTLCIRYHTSMSASGNAASASPSGL